MVFDFTARKFLRREDLSIFIDHMITKNIVFFTLVATNSENRVAPVVGSVFCCVLLCVHSGLQSSCLGGNIFGSLVLMCLVVAVLLFLAVPWVCLQFVIVVFPDHTHLLY